MVTALTTFTLSLSSIDYEIFYGLPGGRITIYDFRQCKHKENDNNGLLPARTHFTHTASFSQSGCTNIHTLFDKQAVFSLGKQKDYCKYLQAGKLQLMNYI